MAEEFFIGNLKIPHRLIAAPMCDITHKPFRRIYKDYGAGLTFTQMVSAKALTMGDKKSKKLLEFDDSERPIGFQIFGNDAGVLAQAARIAQEMGPDLLDLNMGCPARRIVNDGGGSALLKQPEQAKRIFEKMRSVLKIPFTVKMRSGWDGDHEQALEIAKIAEQSGVDALTLHARTKAQGFAGKANWDLVRLFKEELSIPVIGNGDVNSVESIRRMMNETGCDAVMVGRQAVASPWCFKSYLEGAYEPSREELYHLIVGHYERAFDFYGLSGAIKHMRKHLSSYTKGMRDGAAFRSRAITETDWLVLRLAIKDFLN